MDQVISIEKIKKVLEMDISSDILSKNVNMSRYSIEGYQSNQLSILNMKLCHALRIQKYYDNRNEEIEMAKLTLIFEEYGINLELLVTLEDEGELNLGEWPNHLLINEINNKTIFNAYYLSELKKDIIVENKLN